MRILIADDDQSSLQLMTLFFEKYGNCSGATDGMEAIVAVEEAYKSKMPFDLIILDFMMPEMDGLEILAKIRTFEKAMLIPKELAVKVVFISAITGDTLRSEAYELGSIAFVKKPIEFNYLRELIHEEFQI